MKFESRKVSFGKNQTELFDYLSQMENYEELMPEGADFSLHHKGEGFSFQLKGMPKVGLKLKEKKSPEYIIFESPSDNFNYEMTIFTQPIESNSSQAYIDFKGKFNPMIEMMAKKPLTNFLETLTDNLEKKGLK